MSDRPRATTRNTAPQRRARFVAILACLLMSGVIPPHPDALPVSVIPTELLPTSDEGGHDAESESVKSVAPARAARHAPSDVVMSTAPPTGGTFSPSPTSASHRPQPVDRSPVSTPLRC